MDRVDDQLVPVDLDLAAFEVPPVIQTAVLHLDILNQTVTSSWINKQAVLYLNIQDIDDIVAADNQDEADNLDKMGFHDKVPLVEADNQVVDIPDELDNLNLS